MNRTMLHWLWLTLGVVVLDQFTKQWAERTLDYLQPVAIFPGFNLTLVYNTGAAFSLLAQAGGWQRWFFLALSVVVSIVLLVWLLRLERDDWRNGLALALVIAGAIGNGIDRVLYGHVIDFIDLYVGQWHWPAFNIADSAICIGAVLLIVDQFLGEQTSSQPS